MSRQASSIFQSIARNGNVFVSDSCRNTAAPTPTESVGEKSFVAMTTAPYSTALPVLAPLSYAHATDGDTTIVQSSAGA